MNEEIRRAIIAMILGQIPLNATWGKVKEVQAQTVTVTIDELDIENILLGFDKSGVVVYPVVGSDVLVSFFNNSKMLGCVICVKETEKIELFGNEYGGIGLTDKIAERIKRLEDNLDALRDSYNNHLLIYNAHTHPVSGAATLITAPDAANVSTIAQAPKTTQAYISNDLIKHGKG